MFLRKWNDKNAENAPGMQFHQRKQPEIQQEVESQPQVLTRRMSKNAEVDKTRNAKSRQLCHQNLHGQQLQHRNLRTEQTSSNTATRQLRNQIAQHGNAWTRRNSTDQRLRNNVQTTDRPDDECLGNSHEKQLLSGDVKHATTPLAGMQRIARQAVRTATGHLLEHNMLTQEDPNLHSGPMTMEDVDARIRAGMFEITRYCQRLESQYHGPLDDEDASGGGTPDRVTRVNVVTKGGSTTPPHTTVGTEGGSTTPPPTTPPPAMERQSEPPPTTEATTAAEQLWDMTTLFIKCQVLAFFVAIGAFSLYILYCETLGDKTGVVYTMRYGPWRWP